MISSKTQELIATFFLWVCGIAAAILLVYFGSWVFIYDRFVIPTNSMIPTLIPGDNIVVIKPVFGARIYNNLDFLDNDTIDMRSFRTWGLRDIQKNDIVVFNYPLDEKGKNIRFTINLVYAKRCVATPGDTLYIKDGFYNVPSFKGSLELMEEQEKLHRLDSSFFGRDSFRAMKFAYPEVKWTIKNLGPLYIPKKGDVIMLDSVNVKLYKRLIEYETQQILTRQDNEVYIGNTKCDSYRFITSYYFMAGDNVVDSRDSRYFGLVPEEFIVGVAKFILYSKDRQTGDFRLDRFMKWL